MSNPGVSLAHYRQHSRVVVRVTCRDRVSHRDLPLEAVIARLEARGVDVSRVFVLTGSCRLAALPAS